MAVKKGGAVSSVRRETGKSAVEQAKERDAARKAASGSSGGGTVAATKVYRSSGGGETGVSAGSAGSAARPSAGGSCHWPSVDYHQQAKDAAAKGDWGAVSSALAARQAKINAQGGNDRGTSNAQILNELKSQYNASYGLASRGTKDKLTLNSGGKLPFQTDYASGSVYKGSGYDAGTDYLAAARQAASAGDLDGAREALLRRGFKMADTGSAGGGTTQDQAYAEINRLYSQSPVARAGYERELAANRQRLVEHQTQFGEGINPALAYKQIRSADNKFWIVYDGQGKPAAARPVSAKLGAETPKYSQTEIDLMSRYYGGAEDFANVQRQLHNEAVVRTGVGRLVDLEGNYASGKAINPARAEDWTGTYAGDTGQDRAALREILDRINAGESYAGGSVAVPAVKSAPAQGGGAGYRALPSGDGGQAVSHEGRGGGAIPGSYGGSDLSAYLQQMYGAQLNARLAQLQAAYDRQMAQSRANDEKIRQAYYQQQNAAAAQSELQRLAMNEMGAVSGLNTGAGGQMALALGSSLQDSLAALGAAREQDLAQSELQRLQMLAEYNGQVGSAQAQTGAALLGALYDEAVRQENLAYQAQQAALAQQNWERQFQYQQVQDALSARSAAEETAYRQQSAVYDQQSAARKNAYSLATTMLKSGVMPEGETLALAGISHADAAALAAAYNASRAAKTRMGTDGAQDYNGLFQAAYASGTPQSYIANNYKRYGFTSGSGVYKDYQAWAKDTGSLTDGVVANINRQLSNENQQQALGYIKSIWGGLSGREQAALQGVLAKYGVQYTP